MLIINHWKSKNCNNDKFFDTQYVLGTMSSIIGELPHLISTKQSILMSLIFLMGKLRHREVEHLAQDHLLKGFQLVDLQTPCWSALLRAASRVSEHVTPGVRTINPMTSQGQRLVWCVWASANQRSNHVAISDRPSSGDTKGWVSWPQKPLWSTWAKDNCFFLLSFDTPQRIRGERY